MFDCYVSAVCLVLYLLVTLVRAVLFCIFCDVSERFLVVRLIVKLVSARLSFFFFIVTLVGVFPLEIFFVGACGALALFSKLTPFETTICCVSKLSCRAFPLQNLQGKRPGNKVVIFEYSLSGLEPGARFHKALLSIVFFFFFNKSEC